MATIYVSTSGNDANSGLSPSQAKATIAAGMSAASAGDTVLVANGVYEGNVITPKGGSAGNFITVRAETKWGATIKGDNDTAAQSAVEVNHGYVRFEDFEITGDPESGLRNGVLINASNVEIVGNHIHTICQFLTGDTGWQGGAGIDIDPDGDAANVLIDRNLIHNVGLWETSDQQLIHGIYPSAAAVNSRITNNVIYECEDYGIQPYPQSGASGWEIVNNVVAVTGRGIRTADDTIVRNNISFNNATSDFDPRGSGSVFSNNISYGLGSQSRTGVTVTDPKVKDFEARDFRLLPDSPAIDAGTATDAPATDFLGNARPIAEGIDIGAFEMGPVTYVTPVVRSSSSVAVTASSNQVVSKPSELAVGDYLVAVHASDADGDLAQMTAPAEFELLGEQAGNASGNYSFLRVWGKFATQADVDATDFTFTDSTDSHAAVVLFALQAGTFHPRQPLGELVFDFANRSQAGLDIVAPSVEGIEGGLLISCFTADTNNNARTIPDPPPGMVEINQAGSPYALAGVFAEELESAGPTGTRTVTPNPATDDIGYNCCSFVVRPMEVGPPRFLAVTPGTGVSSGTGTITLDAPNGVRPGDHQLAFITVFNPGVNVPTPEGWELIGNSVNTSSGTQFRLWCFYTNSVVEEQEFNKSTTSPSVTVGARIAYRGGAGPRGFNAAMTSNTSNHVLGAVTTTVPDSIVLGVLSEGSASSTINHNTPSGWDNERLDYASPSGIGRVGMLAIYDVHAEDEGTVNGTITAASNGHGATMTLVLRGPVHAVTAESSAQADLGGLVAHAVPFEPRLIERAFATVATGPGHWGEVTSNPYGAMASTVVSQMRAELMN